MKALFRRAQAYMLTQDHIEAKQDLDLALRAEPTNRCDYPHRCSLARSALVCGGVCLSLTLQPFSCKPTNRCACPHSGQPSMIPGSSLIDAARRTFSFFFCLSKTLFMPFAKSCACWECTCLWAACVCHSPCKPQVANSGSDMISLLHHACSV